MASWKNPLFPRNIAPVLPLFHSYEDGGCRRPRLQVPKSRNGPHNLGRLYTPAERPGWICSQAQVGDPGTKERPFQKWLLHVEAGGKAHCKLQPLLKTVREVFALSPLTAVYDPQTIHVQSYGKSKSDGLSVSAMGSSYLRRSSVFSSKLD